MMGFITHLVRLIPQETRRNKIDIGFEGGPITHVSFLIKYNLFYKFIFEKHEGRLREDRISEIEIREFNARIIISHIIYIHSSHFK